MQSVAAQSAEPLSYSKILAEYHENAKTAATNYDKKWLTFEGSLIRMGSDPNGTYFGAVANDGALFDVDFKVSDQAAIAKNFPDGEIKAFVSSSPMAFECFNEGVIGSTITGLKLVDCRIPK